MKYDFTTILYRKGMDAEALDLEDEFFPRDEGCDREKYDFIPMWVADMNFPVFPGITEAITKRISHPCFGFSAQGKSILMQ